ncbi:hypothetical protein GQ53DRAFT_753739 [Thozetella sp. PMI_491]|nr:hypothetical protein GQ53DRAFT_753739 [Thozetella sp. PMI_491]
MRHSLKRPAPRPPPPFFPAVESWLDGIPTSKKPSREELRQWDLGSGTGRSGSRFWVPVILRAFSLLCALIIIVITLTTLRFPWVNQSYLPAVLVPACVIATWDSVEFLLLCLRGDKGLPSKVHIFVDAVLFMGAATAATYVFMEVVHDLLSTRTVGALMDTDIADAAFLIGLMIIHSVLFFFYACTCLDRSSGPRPSRPQVTYLPNGEPIIMTDRAHTPKTVYQQHENALSGLPSHGRPISNYQQTGTMSPQLVASPILAHTVQEPTTELIQPSPLSTPRILSVGRSPDGDGVAVDPFVDGVTPPRTARLPST